MLQLKKLKHKHKLGDFPSTALLRSVAQTVLSGFYYSIPGICYCKAKEYLLFARPHPPFGDWYSLALAGLDTATGEPRCWEANVDS